MEIFEWSTCLNNANAMREFLDHPIIYPWSYSVHQECFAKLLATCVSWGHHWPLWRVKTNKRKFPLDNHCSRQLQIPFLSLASGEAAALTYVYVSVRETKRHMTLVIFHPELNFRQRLRGVLAHTDHPRLVGTAQGVWRVRVASWLS